MRVLIAIQFLVILLASQINLTWSNHYCGPRVVKSSIMIGQGHLSCGMPEMEACDSGIPVETTSFIPVSCCSNEYFSSDSDDFYNKTTSSDVQLPVTELILSTPILAFEGNQSHFTSPFNDTPPSPLRVDIHVLNEVFII